MRRTDCPSLPHGLLFLLVFAAPVALIGCGGSGSGSTGPTNPIGPAGANTLTGTVLAGGAAVANAQVVLYMPGTGGNGTAATDLSSGVTAVTNSLGQFTLSGNFSCPASTSTYVPQAYLVATGGNLANAANNASLVLATALGACSSAISTKGVVVNEVTTVAAAWALAGFMASGEDVASSATNGVGIGSAFANAALIANPSTGRAGGAAMPAGSVLETAKVYALANFLAACTTSGGGTACLSIFSTIGACSMGCSTFDTLQAALYVVKHPGQNVLTVYQIGATASAPPYSGLTSPPHDWTLSMTYKGGGLSDPTELAVDTAGNVWVADYNGAVSAFTSQGAALSPSAGFGSGVLGPEIYGLAVDGSNNVWVDIEEAPSGTSGSISGLYGISSGQTLGSVISLGGATYVSGNAISYPESLATEPNGSIVIGNNGNSTASVFDYTAANGFVFTLTNAAAGYSAEPTDVSGDANGGVWLADEGGYTVTHVDRSGNVLSHPNCCDEANGIATDKLGNAWVANYSTDSVSEVLPGCDSYANANASCSSNQENVVVIGTTSGCTTTNGNSSGCGDATGGLYGPARVAIDAAQNVWVANYRGGTVTEIAGNGGTLAAGTGISPSTTYDSHNNITSQGGYGLDAKMVNPFDVALGASGDLWVSDQANNDLVVFFGLAAPTATPKVPTPVAP